MSEQLGRYVRLEACDGAGKTTQIELAKQYSQENDIDAVFVREPGGTELGILIRELLLQKSSLTLSPETETALFTADRRHLYDEVILPALNAGRLVISDRGIESTLCYQSAGGGIDKKTIMDVSSLLLPKRYMRPDRLALLSVTKEVRQKRLIARFGLETADKIESRDEGYHSRVYDEYKSLESLDYATVVDGNREPEEVFADLKPILFGEYAK